jgi:hypothetical protein
MIGTTGSEIDVSCLVNGARIKADKNQGDSTTKLCGTKVPGSVTYDAKLSGNLDVDPDAGAAGLFALSWSAPGTEQAFTFTPNSADGTAAAGTLVLDPLDFGADAYGDTLTSDFEFAVVGTVTFTYPTGGTQTLELGRPIRAQSRRPLIVADAAPAPTKVKASK